MLKRLMRWPVLGVTLLWLTACGGTVDSTPPAESTPWPPGGEDAPSSGGSAGSGGSGESDGGASGSGGVATASGGSGGIYRDPGCPDVPRVEGPRECEPFSPDPGCGAGNRCIPYVEYGSDCGVEVFGTACVTAGVGIQGDDCAVVDCADQHICVTGGAGLTCVRLCERGVTDDCPSGLLCQSFDVDGFGICY